jgi:hypothetical protein
MAIEIALLAAWLGVGIYQRVAWDGLQAELLQLVVLLAPLHLLRFASLAGWPGELHVLALAFEAVAVVASVLAPPLALVAALAGCLLVAWRPGDERQAPQPVALRALVCLSLLAALACVVSEWVRGWDWRVLRTPALALLAAEALSPRRDRSLGAEERRLTLALCMVVTTWFRILDHLVVALLSGGLAVWVASISLIGLRVGHLPLSERRRTLARLVFRLATPWVAVLGLWATGEAVMRVLPNPYQKVVKPAKLIEGWHIPHASSTYWGVPFFPPQPPDVAPNKVVWNSLGYHDAEHAFEREAGTPRLLVLGDSFVEGFQVKLDELYHRQLESRLEGSEVVALGWSGWGQREELEILKSLGLRFDPDLVVLEFLPANDVMNSSPQLQSAFVRQTTHSSFARPLHADALRKGLFFTALVAEKTDQALRSFSKQTGDLSDQLYQRQPDSLREEWEIAWQEVEELIKGFRDTLRARGAELVVVIFVGTTATEYYLKPPPPEAEVDWRIPNLRFMALCKRLGVACLDLGPPFAKLPQAKRARLQLGNGDSHWSRVGHREAAEITARFLQDGGWLKRARERSATR